MRVCFKINILALTYAYTAEDNAGRNTQFSAHSSIHASEPQETEAVLLSNANGIVHQTLLCSWFW